ncbi:hypothetical protein Aau02nite_49160 [Amorphoplanes auranticolor]|uniref:ATP dependent DNA ligase-like protein n=1 Tax=Actinoplanes auranticolor TaxID=47988 RepID=A0A919SG60_9ACTN|nr:hypothetical protein Aau02nite_49160 [Actinoplanes auranticolor]
MLRPPVQPMRAVGVAELPEPRMCRGGCAYEPKFDGFRALAFVRSDRVYLQSRHGKDLTPYFPNPQEFRPMGEVWRSEGPSASYCGASGWVT